MRRPSVLSALLAAALACGCARPPAAPADAGPCSPHRAAELVAAHPALAQLHRTQRAELLGLMAHHQEQERLVRLQGEGADPGELARLTGAGAAAEARLLSRHAEAWRAACAQALADAGPRG